jgi:hypothetical protein
MLSRRQALFALPLSAAWIACRRAPPPDGNGPAPNTTGSGTPSSALDPSDSVDPAFDGCQRSCGLRSASERARARPQPGANSGDTVFCPVSGAVFRVTESSPRRTARGQLLFFCCEVCAGFFTQHEAEVLRKRGLA